MSPYIIHHTSSANLYNTKATTGANSRPYTIFLVSVSVMFITIFSLGLKVKSLFKEISKTNRFWVS